MGEFAAADRDQLHARYQRAEGPPVWTGDLLDGRRIVGFALASDPGPADQVLVAGDEELAAPPNRPLPASADVQARVVRIGSCPVDGVVAGHLQTAGRAVGDGLDRHLSAMGEPGRFIRRTLESIAGEGHLSWLAGGAVRDLVSAGSQGRPADLDFTGTIGPAELYDAVRRWRRAAGAGDYRQFISRQLVWAVAPPGGGRPDAFVEYKPLTQPGFRFPAWGGSLARDAATRDLTINALYYDHRHGFVADPTGLGMQHLLPARHIAATPYRGDDPVEQACILLRTLKFRLRWPDLDVDAIRIWAAELGELNSRIREDRWQFLVGLRQRCVPHGCRGKDEELRAAGDISPVAASLVEEIRRREKAGT
jgi:hypothetical protein